MLLAKRRAVLSQAIEVAIPLSVREVVMMGRYPHFGGSPAPTDHKLVDELMEFVDVTEFAPRNYQTLSGGERQRVNFARVLAQVWPTEHQTSEFPRCRYLFLDEPLTFLDIHHQIDFMKKVRDFAAATDAVTIGVVHDLNLAAKFADRLYMLKDGRIIAVEIRANDDHVAAAVAAIDDAHARAALDAERAVVVKLGGGCQMPIGAHAAIDGGSLTLTAIVLSLDGTRAVRAESRGAVHEAARVGTAVAEGLLSRGAAEILAEVQQAHAAVEGIQP